MHKSRYRTVVGSGNDFSPPTPRTNRRNRGDGGNGGDRAPLLPAARTLIPTARCVRGVPGPRNVLRQNRARARPEYQSGDNSGISRPRAACNDRSARKQWAPRMQNKAFACDAHAIIWRDAFSHVSRRKRHFFFFAIHFFFRRYSATSCSESGRTGIYLDPIRFAPRVICRREFDTRTYNDIRADGGTEKKGRKRRVCRKFTFLNTKIKEYTTRSYVGRPGSSDYNGTLNAD